MARAFTLAALGHAPLSTRETGRVCQAEDCKTQLSVYNLSKCCWVHRSFADLRGGPGMGRHRVAS